MHKCCKSRVQKSQAHSFPTVPPCRAKLKHKVQEVSSRKADHSYTSAPVDYLQVWIVDASSAVTAWHVRGALHKHIQQPFIRSSLQTQEVNIDQISVHYNSALLRYK